MCLQDLYTALQKFNFKREHIEEAMKSSVLYGGDLHSALDWLCLNLKDGNCSVRGHHRVKVLKKRLIDFLSPEELPDGFSQQLQEESLKNRPKFQPALQEKPAVQSPKASSNTHKDSHKVFSLIRLYRWVSHEGYF